MQIARVFIVNGKIYNSTVSDNFICSTEPKLSYLFRCAQNITVTTNEVNEKCACETFFFNPTDFNTQSDT